MNPLEFTNSEHETKQFMRALFNNLEGFIEVRFINGGISRRFYSGVDEITADEIESWTSEAKSNIYFGVCLRREKAGSKKSISRVTTLWADVDDKDFEEDAIEEALNLLPEKRVSSKELYPDEDRPEELISVDEFPPSIIVDSGHGGHLYWLLKEQVEIKTEDDIERVEGYVLGLAKVLRGDRVYDLARVMRVPLTTNYKDTSHPVKTEFLGFHPNVRYALSDFDRFWTKPYSRIVEKVSFSIEPSGVDIKNLHVSEKIKELVEHGFTTSSGYDSRSNADQAVITALVSGGHTPDEVKSIFSNYPIGEKYQERGKWRDEYLAHSIASARGFLEEQGTQRVSTQKLPQGILIGKDLRQFMSSIDVRAPLVEGLISRGELLLFFAPSGVGKSSFAQSLCAYACAGLPVFELFEVPEPVKCLYLNLEMADVEVGIRFESMFEALGSGSQNFEVDTLLEFDITRPQDRERLLKTVEAKKPDIVVLDPLECLHHKDENSASEMAQVITPLRGIVHDFNCGIVIVHHAGAPRYDNRGRPLPKRIRGSSVVEDKMDNVIEIIDTDKPNTKRLHFTKARSVMTTRRQDLLFDFDWHTYLIRLTSDPKMREVYAKLAIERHHKIEPLLKLMAKDLGTREIGRRIGRNPSTIIRWRSGIREPSQEDLGKLWKLLQEVEV